MTARLFFRDDDLGWSPESFGELLSLFARRGHKLNAAAIPSVCLANGKTNPYSGYERCLQILAHGFSHEARQILPKKSEYPQGRDLAEVEEELKRGLEILKRAYGAMFFPCFVPPWNRIDASLLPAVARAGFAMLSRSGLGKSGELNVTLDLHTLKSGPLRDSGEIVRGIVNRVSGGGVEVVMLHHGKMAPEDFTVLEEVLAGLSRASIGSAFFSEWRRAPA